MASWSDLTAHVRQAYSLDKDSADEFALTLNRREGDVVRAQKAMVRRYQAWGEEMIEIRSAFGVEGEYEPRALLIESLQLPLGAIALHGKYLVLVAKLFLEDHTVDSVVRVLTRVTILADLLEGQSGQDRF